MVRIGVVGYGDGGRYFHTPFIDAAEGIELAGVVTRDAGRRALLGSEHPDVPAYDTLADLLAAGVDAVTVTTPPATRRPLVLEALGAGVHVVADKPFAPDAEGGRDLAAAAAEAGLLLAVFHNRRWDADVRTLRAVLESGGVGEVWRIENRFDADDPATLEAGPTGGLLRDIGSHLVDQNLWLLGPAAAVYATLDRADLPEGRTDVGFTVALVHENGTRSLATSSKLNGITDRALRAYGSTGGYVAHSSDVQAREVMAGLSPSLLGDRWGYEPREAWGTLTSSGTARHVPSERGAYQDFYTAFAAAVRGEGPVPVSAEEGVHVLEVLDAARLSDAEGRVVELTP